MNEKNNPHEYQLITGYCIHCGIYIDNNDDYECHREGNVISISHKVRPNVIRTSPKDYDPSTK